MSSVDVRGWASDVLDGRRAVAWAVAALILGLVLGTVAQLARGERLERRAADGARALTAARVEVALAGAVVEAQAGSYELARQRTSEFYTGLQRRLAPLLAGPAAGGAQRLLVQRDAVVTLLARSDPASVSVLRRLWTDYRAHVVVPAGLDAVAAAGARP